MQYTETKEKSAELLRTVVGLMGQHPAPFNPVTYTVWYEYAAGINAALNADLDRYLQTEPRLSDATIQRLYREHIAGLDDKTMDRISRDFRQVMERMADSVERTGDRAGAFDQELSGLNAALQGTQPSADLHVQLQHALLSSRAMQDSAADLKAQVVASRQEIERLRADLDHARQEVFIDSLTKVLNRKGLDHQLERLLSAEAPASTGHGLVMLDIDHFKAINDTHGHLAGDQVLAAMGEVLRRGVTGPDHWVARYGGEEFAIVLPGAQEAETRALAEKVRTLAKAMKLRKRNDQDVVLSVTVSAGVACWRAGEAANDWIARADAALYQSKQNGRDQVRCAA